jgi:hypothetical protein
MALNALPATGREAADAGVIRLRVSGGVSSVSPPFPFLERFLCSVGTCRLSFTDCLGAVRAARAMPRLSGAPGRRRAFELAAVLELSLPGIPLMRHMLACPELEPVGLLLF